MTTFRPVNTTIVPELHARPGEESNPLTPRPNTAPSSQLPTMNRDDATTPTRANFGALASQRPLPTPQSFPAAINPSNQDFPKGDLDRVNSQHSSKSQTSDEIAMGSDAEGDNASDDSASLNPDGTRSKKKTKSQKFYCTDYPPCCLSFTRSEHLARHIRKHTGERPFQCHCSRRFSRLDNLRQHAQTVHQNEEIPGDSLAATGTRFQRQVRTDRVRPPGSRSRASTAGSQSGPIRGHQRNSLSASSIGSVASVYSQRDDPRSRPPPLIMAGGDPRARYSQEAYRPETPNGQYPYRPQSPGFSTPTSATFSTGQNSPHWGSGMQSPPMGHSRTQSLYNGHQTPGRRLSVPSAGNPFQSPHGNNYPPPSVFSQINNSGSFSPVGSMLGSPTASISGSGWSSRRESLSTVEDAAWRRRTWHPDTYSQFGANSSFTSRLQQVTTPSHYATHFSPPLPQPPIVPSNAPPQHPRLPGIESFDPLPRPASPVRRQPSPMMIDTPTHAPQQQQSLDPYRQERPNSQHWEQGINRTMNQLDLQGTTDAASSWANDAHRAVQAQAERVRAQEAEQVRTQHTVRFEESTYSVRPQTSGGIYRQQHASAPPATPTKSKRMGWYHGPLSPPGPVQLTQYPQAMQRPSPVESSGSEGGIPGTPGNLHVTEIIPSIVHSNGDIERHEAMSTPQTYGHPSVYPKSLGELAQHSRQSSLNTSSQIQYQPPPPNSSENHMRLEALVAVATNADKVPAY